ncbi:MAG: AAA family ATPase [Blastocatellales bacterium]
MPKHELPIIAVVETLENTGCFTEALFFPEILRFHFDEDKAVESLEANVRKIVEDLPLAALSQRHPAGEPELDETTITIDPPRGQNLWRTPVTLKFSIVRWSHGDVARLAYIPALCIVAAATKPATKQALDQLIQQHIRATLARRDSLNSLDQLVWLQRAREIKVINSVVEASLLTPKQFASDAEKREAEKQSALAESASDLAKEKLPVAFELDETVAQIAETLTGRAQRSVLLVGRSGVGKTAAVYELARRRHDFQLAHTPFWATNGARLVAGMSGFGQWQERCQRLWREAAQERAIIYLGNLIELMEVGKSVSNSQGIANFLRPYIARGDVLSIAECTPEQLTLIERANPRLLDAFYHLKIEEPSVERGRGVLLNFALAQANGNSIELEAIERIDQLHRRYATYSAYPGRPVRFLQNLLLDRPEEKTLDVEDVTDAFSRETGLPRVLLDEGERLDLKAAREWFASRVIGQPDAVDLIVDLLAMVKAGLTRPRKPIASLLFIGPTGVGKTEMAKSLAEFLFQDRARMTRFDMSEYSDPLAVNRLIGGVFSQANQANSEGLLTAKVREQPFAVILLDEFEKAHPSFFDLLLQILGEGRLTDSMGRVADFSNAVVIMTSNLGAESFQRGLAGFGQTAATRQAASKHFTNAVRTALRPELFNRIDRIAPFAPLDEASALRIAEREIERVKTRDGIRYRGVTIKVWDGVARHFAHRGYDPRYGARPLKRVIERELLVPLSELLNERKNDEPVQINLWVEDEKLKLDFQYSLSDESAARSTLALPLAELARQCSSLRRESQMLERSAAARNLQNEIYTLQRVEKQLKRGRWKNPEELARVAELPKLQLAEQAIKNFAERITQLEHEIMLTLYGNAEAESSVNAGETGSRYSTASADWKELLLRIYTLKLKEPDKITIAVFSEDHKRLFDLARIYYLLAMARIGPDAKVEVRQFTPKPPAKTRKYRDERNDESRVERTKIEKPDQFFAAPRENVLGIALGVNFPMAFPKLELERGLHTFTKDKKPARCLVDVSAASIEDYRPPANITRRDAIGHQEKRRNYSVDQSLIDDLLLDRRETWAGQLSIDVVERLIEESLMAKVKRLVQI